jgi:hypothetical protein
MRGVCHSSWACEERLGECSWGVQPGPPVDHAGPAWTSRVVIPSNWPV